MNEVIAQSEISSNIFTLRGEQVMPDRPSTSSGTDLAKDI